MLTKLDELFHRIRSDQSKRFETKVHEPLLLHLAQISPSSDKSLRKLDGEFLHRQLLIDCLLRMKTDSTARQQLTAFCKERYRYHPNELDIIREFQETYTPQRALWWYTRESCLYRLLNKALRVQNIDVLYLFGFFLGDLARQLRQNQLSATVRVYRGQMMSMEEVDQLKNSLGEYLSINTFFSTSLSRRKALKFLLDESSSDGLQRVLFEIDADPISSGEKSFANIKSLSYYSHEEEILFLVGSIFRVTNIKQEKSGVWTIHMNLSHSQDKNLHSLFNDIKQQSGHINDDATLVTFGNVLYQIGRYEQAKKYFQLCLENFPDDLDMSFRCYHALGVIALIHNDYEGSLQWHEKVLQSLPSNDPRLAESYNCIGCIYQKKGDSQRALEYYQQALNSWRNQLNEEHYQIADCLNNMGCVYEIEKKYSQALQCHEQALNIRKKCLSQDHPDLGGSYNNIGNVYLCMDEYDLALKNYESSYEIKKKSLPSGHPSLTTTLENLALVYERKGQLTQALACYQNASTILRQTLPSTHADVIEIQEKIDEISILYESLVVSTRF